MRTLVTLALLPPDNTFEFVRGLPVLRDLSIDLAYGLVSISPKKGLYVIRVDGAVDREELMAVPQVRGVHGDVRISTVSDEQGE